jgi:predicted O-methyltransferase YrrM
MRQILAAPLGRYLADLHPPVDPLIEEIRAEGIAGGLPLVEPETGRLLRTLVAALEARAVLEIGTAVGYSALWMAQALGPGGRLISLELDATRAATARRNIERAGLSEMVNVIVGDASRFVHKVAGPFDLIFQDPDKRLYEPLLDTLIALLRPGGVLVTDNVLWDGEVIDGFVETRRHDLASTEAIRAYNRRLAAEARLLTTFLPIGDGVALSVRVGLWRRRDQQT